MTVSGDNKGKDGKANRSIIELSHEEARSLLLKPESYCTIDLPPYIRFQNLIEGITKILGDKKLSDFRESSPRYFDDVNHLILNNKDGRHAWRPLQLIHPALYVSLVNRITEKDNWVSSADLRKALDARLLIDSEEMEYLDEVAPPEEVALFVSRGEINS